MAIVVPIGVVLVLFLIGFFLLRRKAKRRYLSVRLDSGKKYNKIKNDIKIFAYTNYCINTYSYNIWLVVVVRYEMGREENFQFAMDEIETATDNFSDDNKIGEGGFGVVYKVEIKIMLKVNLTSVHQFYSSHDLATLSFSGYHS